MRTEPPLLCGGSGNVTYENGDEIATFTSGVGWQTYSSKEEKAVDRSMTFAYYNAYIEARHAMKTGMRNISPVTVGDGNVIGEGYDGFDAKA